MSVQTSKPQFSEEEVLNQLLGFWRAAGRGHRATWPDETMRNYFRCHAAQGGLIYLRDPQSGGICALMVYWKLPHAKITEPNFLKETWAYSRTNMSGDCAYLDAVICDRADCMASLCSEIQWRLPTWRALRWFAIREGALVEYRPEQLARHLERFLFAKSEPLKEKE